MSRNCYGNKNTYSTLILTAGVCLTSLSVQAGPPGTYVAPVAVENTADNPVPVTGAVTIENNTESPVPVLVQNPASIAPNDKYIFVGLTEDPVPASTGALGMDLECQAAFANPQARMCDTREYFDTPDKSTHIGSGWIWPEVVSSYYDTDKAEVHHVIYPGASFKGDIGAVGSCHLWQRVDTSLSGAVVNTDSGSILDRRRPRVLTRNCGNTLRVSCCAPR